ncbi:MAG: hypothetical protein ABIL62_17870 [Planctomycetota bacterium]
MAAANKIRRRDMPNLFWKNKNKKTVNVVESPFKSEEEFERYIYGTKEILGDIFILKRQVRTSTGRHIPDMIGIDKEINKFAVGSNEFILVDKLEPETRPGMRITRGLGVYDKEYYLQNYNNESVVLFFQTIGKVERLVKTKGWKLEKKFNQSYVGFKYGFPNVFGINWVGTKSFCIFFKLPKNISEKIKISGIKPYRYEEQWNQVLYKVEGKDYSVQKLMPLFKASYKHITGIK